MLFHVSILQVSLKTTMGFWIPIIHILLSQKAVLTEMMDCWIAYNFHCFKIQNLHPAELVDPII